MPNSPISLSQQSGRPLWTADDALTGLVDIGRDLGLDASPQLLRHGLLEQAMDPGKGIMPFASFVELLEDIAAEHDCPNFGFWLGRKQRPLSYGLVSQIPALCANLGEAFECFSRYSKLYSDSFSWIMEIEDDEAIMRRHATTAYNRPMNQIITYSLTLAFVSFRHLIGASWKPDGIYFTHSAPPDAEPLRRYFQTPIFYQTEFCGIAFPAKALDHPIETANPDLLASLGAYFDNLLAAEVATKSLTERVDHEIRSQLGSTGISLAAVAQRFGMHPRAFQRALSEEGQSFRQLYNTALNEAAIHLLGSSKTPVSDIAYMLGFAHASALARAVKVQTGMSPSQLRQTLKTPLGKSRSQNETRASQSDKRHAKFQSKSA